MEVSDVRGVDVRLLWRLTRIIAAISSNVPYWGELLLRASAEDHCELGRNAGVVAVTSSRIFRAFHISVEAINVDNDRRSRRYVVMMCRVVVVVVEDV